MNALLLCCLQAAAVQELVSSGALPDSAADSSCLLAPLAGVMSSGLLDLMRGDVSVHDWLAGSLAALVAWIAAVVLAGALLTCWCSATPPAHNGASCCDELETPVNMMLAAQQCPAGLLQ
jgi:hypothetical protein